MAILSVHRRGELPERRDLDAIATAGGSQADDVHLPGCPPGALRLVPCPAGVVVEAIAAGVRAGGRPVPPGGRRLLREGERVELQGLAIALDSPAERDDTLLAAAALLRGAAAGALPLAGPHLVVLSGPAAGSRHPLRAVQTLGRGRAATIAIPDPLASRVHARIRIGSGGAATVEDLRSRNGVRVNGVRIDRRPRALCPGDELGIGETALAVVHGGSAPHARPPRGRRVRPAPHSVAAALLALAAAALALAAR